jgi:hypothetical protein
LAAAVKWRAKELSDELAAPKTGRFGEVGPGPRAMYADRLVRWTDQRRHQRQQIEKMQSGSFKQIVGRMKKWFETNF